MLVLVIRVRVRVVVSNRLLRCGVMMPVMWSTGPASPAGETLDHSERPALQNGTRLPVEPPCRKTPEHQRQIERIESLICTHSHSTSKFYKEP